MAKLLLVNPRKRRKASRKSNPVRKLKSYKRRRRNPLFKKARRRRNPIAMRLGLNPKTILKGTVMPAVTAAGGAVVLDLLWANLPLPATIKTGPAMYLAKAAGAIGIGVVGGKVLGKQTGDMLALGALTVVAYSALKGVLAPMLPGLGMYVNGLGYMNPGQLAGLGAYVDGSGMVAADPMRDIGSSDLTQSDLNPAGDSCQIW